MVLAKAGRAAGLPGLITLIVSTPLNSYPDTFPVTVTTTSSPGSNISIIPFSLDNDTIIS